MTKLDIRELSDLLASSRSVRERWQHPWWRGQADSSWSLLPKVQRVSAHDVYETNLMARFMQMAPGRHAMCPNPDQLANWLFLAQHYGLPTRLLDWSESPLVALFFAVADETKDSEAGTLWALNPLQLNFLANNGYAVLVSQHPEVQRLVDLAFAHVAATDNAVLAVAPNEVDTRLMVQLAGFTLHGSGEPLEKRGKEELTTLGIRQRSVFPDLYNLASDLARGTF